MAKISIFPFIAKKIKKCLGIVEDTDIAEHTIALGKYVVWKGNLCKSSEAIPEGAALSSSNLTDVPDGGLNELNSNITKIRKQDTLYDWGTAVNANTWLQYELGGSIANYEIIIIQMKHGSSLSEFIITYDAFSQSSVNLTIRKYISINETHSGRVEFYKVDNTHISIYNGIGIQATVRIIGMSEK